MTPEARSEKATQLQSASLGIPVLGEAGDHAEF